MRKLSDSEVWDRLYAAGQILGNEEGLTGLADNALKTARLALTALQMALLKSMEDTSKGDKSDE